MLGKLFSAAFSFLGTFILSAVVTGVIFGLLFLALKALKAISLWILEPAIPALWLDNATGGRVGHPYTHPRGTTMFGHLADGAVRETDCLVEFHDITGFVTCAKGRSPAGVLPLCAGYFDLTGTIVEDADNGIAVLRQVQHISDA